MRSRAGARSCCWRASRGSGRRASRGGSARRPSGAGRRQCGESAGRRTPRPRTGPGCRWCERSCAGRAGSRPWPTSGRRAAWLAEIVPELRAEIADLPEPAGGTEEGRFQIYDALAELLRRAARDAPLLVVLDDLQWADEASLLTLAFVARALPDAGVALLGTYRSTELPHDEHGASALAGLIGWSRRIELRGLGAASIRRLIEDRGHDAPDDDGRADPRRDGWQPALRVGAADAARGRGPARRRLRGGRAAASRRRARGDRTASRAACAQGAGGARGRVGDRHAVPGRDAVACRRRASRRARGAAGTSRSSAACCIPWPTVPERYAFSHGLVQATLYDGLAESRRVELHRLVGETLEALYGEEESDARLTELAHHFLEAAAAGDADRRGRLRTPGRRPRGEAVRLRPGGGAVRPRARRARPRTDRASGSLCCSPWARHRRVPETPTRRGGRCCWRPSRHGAMTTPRRSAAPHSGAGSGACSSASTRSSCGWSTRRSSVSRESGTTACSRA